MKKNEPATPADMVKNAREQLGEAITLIDVARSAVALGEQPNLGAVITRLERAEQALEELDEEVGA